MRLYEISMLALAAAACAPAAGPKEPSHAQAPVDEAAVASGVEALVREWSAAGAEGRWDDLKALYADDPGFAWIEQGRVAYADHAAVIAGVDQVASMGAMIRSEVEDIVATPLCADVAAFRASTKIGFVSPDFSFDFEGAFTGVAVRDDGRWRFLNGHLSQEAAT